MLSWLYDLLIGNFCNHKWEILTHGPLQVEGRQYGTYFIQQCKHCGNIKTIKSTS